MNTSAPALAPGPSSTMIAVFAAALLLLAFVMVLSLNADTLGSDASRTSAGEIAQDLAAEGALARAVARFRLRGAQVLPRDGAEPDATHWQPCGGAVAAGLCRLAEGDARGSAQVLQGAVLRELQVAPTAARGDAAAHDATQVPCCAVNVLMQHDGGGGTATDPTAPHAIVLTFVVAAPPAAAESGGLLARRVWVQRIDAAGHAVFDTPAGGWFDARRAGAD